MRLILRLGLHVLTDQGERNRKRRFQTWEKQLLMIVIQLEKGYTHALLNALTCYGGSLSLATAYYFS